VLQVRFYRPGLGDQTDQDAIALSLSGLGVSRDHHRQLWPQQTPKTTVMVTAVGAIAVTVIGGQVGLGKQGKLVLLAILTQKLPQQNQGSPGYNLLGATV
jgi:hypothetical protein